MKKYFYSLVFAALVIFTIFIPSYSFADQKPKIYCVSSVEIDVNGCEEDDPGESVPYITAGHNGFTLTVIGKHFNHNPVIYIGALAMATTRFDSQKLTTKINSGAMQTAGVYYISVVSEDGASNVKQFTVYNVPPTINNLLISTDFCPTAPATLPIFFSWNYNDYEGDAQQSFQFQIDDSSNFSSPIVNATVQSPANPNQQSVNVIVNGNEINSLLFNKPYYWRVLACQVTVNPSLKSCTSWTYDSGGAAPNNATTTAPGAVYNTILYPGPYVNFTYTGTSPAVQFTNQSACYDIDGVCNSYLWNFGDGVTSTVKNPSHTYPASQTYSVNLQVTDGSPKKCSISKNVNAPNFAITAKVRWKEISTYDFDYAFSGGVCGNVVIEPPETCDDGNLIDGDGCSSICSVEAQPPPGL